MGTIRCIGSVQAPNTAGWRSPILLPMLTTLNLINAAASFTITKNIATIFLNGTLPTNGYNGPNGYPTQNAATKADFDIYGGVNGGGPPAGGQQVMLWGFTTATYFNGCTVTVLDCNPATNSFRFYFNNANVANTADAGSTAAIPNQAYRSVRLECLQTNSTNIVYVGDLNVSSTVYDAALTLTGQGSFVLQYDNIRADRIWVFGSAGSNCGVMVSLVY